jgi:hypothetical protein
LDKKECIKNGKFDVLVWLSAQNLTASGLHAAVFRWRGVWQFLAFITTFFYKIRSEKQVPCIFPAKPILCVIITATIFSLPSF